MTTGLARASGFFKRSNMTASLITVLLLAAASCTGAAARGLAISACRPLKLASRDPMQEHACVSLEVCEARDSARAATHRPCIAIAPVMEYRLHSAC